MFIGPQRQRKRLIINSFNELEIFRRFTSKQKQIELDSSCPKLHSHATDSTPPEANNPAKRVAFNGTVRMRLDNPRNTLKRFLSRHFQMAPSDYVQRALTWISGVVAEEMTQWEFYPIGIQPLAPTRFTAPGNFPDEPSYELSMADIR
ncbi:hypothetical protein RUM43_005424 [Polyplax serrata]|uniref:Uncharacterized protein n=1 Tax=Polyplax serrata TaxID=468196 RepID=A0AAN8S1G7_POLSC